MKPKFDPLLDEQESVAKVWLKRGVIIVALLSVLGGIGYGISQLMKGGAPHKKQVTTIKLLPDTPSPPPPPPPKEPPKEQPKEQPKEAPKEPEPKPVETPPAENLKMEGPAGDGPSPFEAGNVTNDYKGGDVNTIGGGPNKHQFAWYTGLIKERIEDALAKDPTLANGAYKVVVKVWIATNGKIQRHELVGSSGKSDIDDLINKALDGMPALTEGPPAEMPQPVKLKVTARSIGKK
jgi:periplasmic protein TonB